MRKIDFYTKDYTLEGDRLPDIKMIRTDSGGLDLYINGVVIPGVMACEVSLERPFPCVLLQIGMNSITWDGPDSLNDSSHRRNQRHNEQKNVQRKFPWDWLPTKIKTRFCKR